MEQELERTKSLSDLRMPQGNTHHAAAKRPQKRRRRYSSESNKCGINPSVPSEGGEGRLHGINEGGGRQTHSHYRTPNKKPRLSGGIHGHKRGDAIVSSKKVAEKIMKIRLGGSVSDPLNLEGGEDVETTCSTCAPSPSLEEKGQRSPPPDCLIRDPLNLEGKVKEFPLRKKTGGGKR